MRLIHGGIIRHRMNTWRNINTLFTKQMVSFHDIDKLIEIANQEKTYVLLIATQQSTGNILPLEILKFLNYSC